MGLLPEVRDGKIQEPRKRRIRKQKHKRHKEKQFREPRYENYIVSKLWARRRRAYYKNNPKRCAACGSKYQVGLHHMTYARLGRELDEDLAPLCWDCHQELHEQIGRGSKVGDTVAASSAFIAERQEVRDLEGLARTL